ncbi:MAG: tetratricopeptide repeat protein [Myxococcota bacterium]
MAELVTLLRRGLLRRAVLLWLLIQIAIAVALSFVPLLNVLGFERAFASSLLAAPAGAMIAISLAEAHGRGRTTAIAACFYALLALVPTVIAGQYVERQSTPCNPAEGLAFLALTGGTGAIFGVGLGLAASATQPLHRHPRWIAALVLLGALGYALFRLWSEPQIFVYSLPFGYWPGSLYDEEVKIGRALVAHRALALSIGLALIAMVTAVTDETGQGFGSPHKHKGAVLLLGLSLISSLLLWNRRELLGFDQDRATIERSLSRHVDTEHFKIFVDASIPEEKLKRLVDEHELRYRQHLRFFGHAPESKIKSYVYRDGAQKRRLMGAAGTQISRPWAGEFHIDGFDTPHPVLKHELAHVFAGALSTGLLKSPAKMGVMVNLTLIEGLAVAADWPSKGLTVHEWARAMRALKLAPDVRTTLYPAGFWAVSSSRAYTIAGSFIRHLIDTRGIDKFMEAYRQNNIEGVYGTSLDALATEWEATIDALPLGKEALEMAEHRFKAPGIFQKTCAHTTANLIAEGYARLGAQDLEGAAKALDRAFDYDPSRVDVVLTLAKAYAQRGKPEEARKRGEKARDNASATARSKGQALELLADLDWKAQRLDEARAELHAVLDLHVAEEIDRLMQVKLRALDEPPAVSETLRAYLSQELPIERAVGILAELAHARPDDVLVRYLYAKLLENVGAYREAAQAAQEALRLGLPTEELTREARLIQARSLLLFGDRAQAARRFLALTSTHSPPALRLEAADWAERAGTSTVATSTVGE